MSDVLGQHNSPMSYIDSSDLTQRVTDRLKVAIVRGDLAGGARINQEDMAKQLGVSRSPVRAAISVLRGEGMVDRTPSGGMVVRELHMRDVRGAYGVRATIELSAIRDLATDVSSEAVARISAEYKNHRDKYETYSTLQLMEADRNFHTVLLEETGNPYYNMAMRPIWPVVERIMWRTLQMTEVPEVAWTEHGDIIAALQAGDADVAASTLEKHLKGNEDRLVQVLRPSTLST